MSTCQVVQLSIISFRPEFLPQDSTSPPDTFLDLAAKIKAVPGTRSSYLGHQLENPRKWVWVVNWATGAALDAFRASPSYERWFANLHTIVDSYASVYSPLSGDIKATLASPCTEVVTAYDVEDTFVEDNLKHFARILGTNSVPGYYASAYGLWRPLVFDNISSTVGHSASILIGWTSKEARIAQRSIGTPIGRSLDLFHTGCKTASAYHVRFKRL